MLDSVAAAVVVSLRQTSTFFDVVQDKSVNPKVREAAVLYSVAEVRDVKILVLGAGWCDMFIMFLTFNVEMVPISQERCV